MPFPCSYILGCSYCVRSETSHPCVQDLLKFWGKRTPYINMCIRTAPASYHSGGFFLLGPTAESAALVILLLQDSFCFPQPFWNSLLTSVHFLPVVERLAHRSALLQWETFLIISAHKNVSFWSLRNRLFTLHSCLAELTVLIL